MDHVGESCGRGVTRRLVLAAAVLTPTPLLATAACGRSPVSDAVSLPDFRRASDPDDTAALARAFATGRPVHAPADQGRGPEGQYLVGNDASSTLPSGATLFGDGAGRTIIMRSVPSERPFIVFCDSGSPDPERNITGLRFRDLTFADDVAGLGFSEFSYLVMLNGVSDARFDRVDFQGFRGDGLHLGSSTTLGIERHNRSIVVSDCTFDGVNANNRNGISVIDVDGLVIEGSRFINISRRGNGTAGRGDPMNPATGLAQPGAIDLEPNADVFAVIRNVIIRGNAFTGGGGFAVALLLRPNDAVRTPQHSILIEDNMVRDRAGGFEAFGFAGNDAVTSDRPYAVTLRNNTVERCEKPFIISGIRGCTLAGNHFRDCRGHAELGYEAANAEVTLTGNLFERVGGPALGFALWMRTGTNITLIHNRFVDAGSPGEKSGVAIAVVKGTLSGLTLRGNRFRAPEGRTGQAAMVFKDAIVDQRSLRLDANETLGLPLAQALRPPR